MKLIHKIDNWLCLKFNYTSSEKHPIKAKFLDILIKFIWRVEEWMKKN